MISAKKNLYVSSVLIILLALNVVSNDAKRHSIGRTRTRPSGRGSVSRTPVHVPKPSSHVPSRPHVPSSPNFPQPHTPHNPGSNQGKDSSSILLQAEGGGRPRPGTITDHKQQAAPHQPSAPKEQPSHKVNTGHVQSQGPSSSPYNPSGGYPPWANPAANPQGGSIPHVPYPSAPHTSQPHGAPSSPNMPYNPSQPNQAKPGAGPLGSVPYPPTHPAGPILPQPMNPSHQPNQNSYPHPNSPHGAPPPYAPSSAPYPNSHAPGMPMPAAPHIGFGNGPHGGVHQPIGSPPMQPHGGIGQPTVIHNHYNAPPIGSPQNPAGNPVYGHQPVYGGSPMGQPFVPGQTVVVLPNQQSQSSGPGFGQLLKEALVFSTVNVGVNKLLNGGSHHHHDNPPAAQPAAPASAPSTVTNTVIYNNPYGPPNSGASGTPPQGQPGQAAPMIPSPTGTPNGTPSPPTNGNSNPSAGTPNPGVGSAGIPSSTPGTNPVPAGPSMGTPAIPEKSNNLPANSNGTASPRTSSGPTNSTDDQAAPPVQEFRYFISNEELWNITEDLFDKNEMNGSECVTLKLQHRSGNDTNDTDHASKPLLYMKINTFALPTIEALRDIHDNYEFDSERTEMMDSIRRRQENHFLDVFMNTTIMKTTMNWLSTKGYVEPDDEFEWRDAIRHIWMAKVNRATSGFERIFMAEKYPGPSVIGGQNWIYFENQELLRRINYMSYVDKINLGDKATLLKINIEIDGVMKPNTAMLVGTPPELEMALYTICYYARPNDVCIVSLAGKKLNIYTHGFRYFGKDVMDLGIIFF